MSGGPGKAAVNAPSAPLRTETRRPQKEQRGDGESFWSSVLQVLEEEKTSPGEVVSAAPPKGKKTQTAPEGGEALPWIPALFLWREEEPSLNPAALSGSGEEAAAPAGEVPGLSAPGGKPPAQNAAALVLAPAPGMPEAAAAKTAAPPAQGDKTQAAAADSRETAPGMSESAPGSTAAPRPEREPPDPAGARWAAGERPTVRFLVGAGETERQEEAGKRPDLPQQISEGIRKQTNGGQTEFELELTPRHLGKIRVRLALDGAGSHIELTCFSPETKKLLLEQSEQLLALVGRHGGGKVEVRLAPEGERSPQKSAGGEDEASGGQPRQESRQQSQEQRKRRSDLAAERFWQTLQGRVSS